MKRLLFIAIPLVLLLLTGIYLKTKVQSIFAPSVTPTPTDEPLVQLSPDQQPELSLSFSADSHYVTVNISNIHAQALEYNIIYEAIVKKVRINTGVNASVKLNGEKTYSKQQLLGSESSGKFTYHQDIKNAVLELTLRDAKGRSIFSSTYPFTVLPGKSTDLTASK